MQANKLSIHAAMDGFKGGFSFYINHSTIFSNADTKDWMNLVKSSLP